MKPAFELVGIQIVDLRGLPDPGFDGTKQDLVDFALSVLQNGKPEERMLEEHSRRTDPVKAQRFVDLVLSIRDVGYRALGVNSDREYYEGHFRPLALQHPLITIDGRTHALVDGNHRAATLLALGVEFFPVAQVHCQLVSDDREAEWARRYMLQYDTHISIFLNSQPWQDYTQSDCYRLSFER